MIANNPLFILIPVFFLPLIRGQANPRQCNQTWVSNGTVQSFPYPFGFSSGCGIRLNCTTDGGIFIGEFPVQSVGSDNIIVSVKTQCNRSFDSFRQLFSPKYAPTSRNAIFVENCSRSLPCSLQTNMVENQFKSGNCKYRSGSVNCYFENALGRHFMSYENLNCQYLLSSISAEDFLNGSVLPKSLKVGTIELGWWLEGECQCSDNANCTKLSIDGKPSYRCLCKDGFDGDGYLAGNGCRKAKKACSPAKYMSGQCGGTARFLVFGGIVLGAILMISLGVIFCCLRRRTKLRVTKSTKIRLTEATENYSVSNYPYKDIERATNSFSEKQRLGTGAYGTVYAGKLHNNEEWVAIKRIKHRDTDSIKQVMNEIKLLSSVSHPNLVRLLGFSIEHGEQILVYEFMPNGTLSQHLQRERGTGLSWPVRLAIAIETAEAVAHLHSAIIPPIFHRDIKSSNILLDHSFKSKVADFGLSRLGMTEISHISTAPQGTPGYVDPQYHQDFQLSDKSDVYSFGVVLVEMITGLKVVDFSRSQNEVNLASLVTERIRKGLVDEIIDPFLQANMDSWTLFSIQKVAELAFRCLAFHRDMRPSMMEVATELEQTRNCIPSIELSSAFSNEILKPPSVPAKKAVQPEGEGLIRPQAKLTRLNSPVSVQDPELWLSEHSSTSSSSLSSKLYMPIYDRFHVIEDVTKKVSFVTSAYASER